MPQTYPASGPNSYKIPQYTEKADGVAAFQQFIDSLEPLITPIGTVVPWAGTSGTPPTGWLLCNGEQYPTKSYPALSKLCGTTYGTAQADYFRVPNLKGRLVVSLDASDTSGDFAAVGNKGGTKAVTLGSENLPSHDHSVPVHSHTAAASGSPAVTVADAADHNHTAAAASDGQHQHDTRVQDATNFDRSGTGKGAVWAGSSTNNLTAQGGTHTHAVTVQPSGKHSHTATVDATGVNVKVNDSAVDKTGATGTSKPFLSLGPYLVLQYIIRADIVRA